LLIIGLGATSLGCGGASDQERVEAYCAYAASSEAQWRGCVEHVTIKKVRSRNTPAADFALNGGDCPRETYCAEWQEGWGYCQDASPDDPLCGDKVTQKQSGTNGVYDAPSPLDRRSDFDRPSDFDR
jgi:hypothetical protein